MKKRIPILLLCLCMLTALAASPVLAASEVPYQTYTYDKWNNATPSPNGYIPSRSIGGAQLGCGSFSDAEDMFYSEALGLVFIADTGNDRVVVLSEELELVETIEYLTQENGEQYTFSEPEGVYALDDGTVYVCDTGNQKIVLCDLEGNLLSVLPTPESNLLPDNFNYQPTKLVTDESGRMYIISRGTYQGLIYLDTDGSFIRFFGANDVEMTLQRQIMKLWKSLLTDEAAASMQSFNPIEYGNLFMSEDGYIYATAAGSENGSALMTKLNPLGIDRLPYQFSSSSSRLFADVTVDSDGITTLLVSSSGLIMQLDENGNNMFSFGGTGDQTGLFERATSIIEVGDRLYVMDGDKDTITEFELTQFGELVHNAMALYNDGAYLESIEPWLEVIEHDANYLLAYTGIGKAYYQLKDYETAMYYYKLANDRSDYSVAYKEASLNLMRSSFSWIVLGLALAVLVIFLLRRYLKSRSVPLSTALANRLRRMARRTPVGGK